MDRNFDVSLNCSKEVLVALRKESVDRNIPSHWMTSRTGGSLSARRAWIEIERLFIPSHWMTVALRKESVDRNSGNSQSNHKDAGRSPQGERG